MRSTANNANKIIGKNDNEFEPLAEESELVEDLSENGNDLNAPEGGVATKSDMKTESSG